MSPLSLWYDPCHCSREKIFLPNTFLNKDNVGQSYTWVLMYVKVRRKNILLLWAFIWRSSSNDCSAPFFFFFYPVISNPSYYFADISQIFWSHWCHSFPKTWIWDFDLLMDSLFMFVMPRNWNGELGRIREGTRQSQCKNF